MDNLDLQTIDIYDINGTYGCHFQKQDGSYPYWLMIETTGSDHKFWLFENSRYGNVPNLVGQQTVSRDTAEQLTLEEVKTWGVEEDEIELYCSFQIFYTFHNMAEKMIRESE